MMGEEEIPEGLQRITALQKKVISYGRQSIWAWIFAVIFGILCLGAGGYAFYLARNEATDEETLRIWKFTAYICLALTDYSLCAYFYGKYLKKAAEDRDVKSLKVLLIIWLIQDLIFVVAVFICVLVAQLFPFLIVLICAGIDFYRLTMIWKFIQECKANSYSGSSAYAA